MHFRKAKGILSPNNGMNLYRGCTHGCIYCDSRSVVYGMDHAFEDIEVKENALDLLEDALMRKRRPCMIGTGAMSDPYIREELDLKMTRRALEIINRFGFGLAIQTKSSRIERDIDILKEINEKAKCVVQMTLTTIDDDLARILEPNVSVTSERIRTLNLMKEAGIPTVVWLCPLLPMINDTVDNVKGLLEACVSVGVKGIVWFGAGMTLREGNREYFYKALDRHFPGLRSHYEHHYGNRYSIGSDNHPVLDRMVKETCKEHGIMHDPDEVFAYMRTLPEKHPFRQLSIDDL